MQRAQRKLEHIKYALELGDGPVQTHFDDLSFIHNCLPEINPADIDLSVKILGKQLRLPFFIDAITGSTDAVTEINRQLVQVASSVGIGIAVGSQFGAVAQETGLSSYHVVREEYPDGLVIGNISALASYEQAQAAVDMLQADALEVHLNAAQELWMSEGDKNYSGMLQNMHNIRKHLAVPVIVKETGCGIAYEQYQMLLEKGFTAFNCAGAGGTNFPAIEARRANITLLPDFLNWGLPTCWSLLDAQCVPSSNLLCASGGIRTGAHVARAFALGADVIGITGSVLAEIMQHGVSSAINYLNSLGDSLRNYLLLTGCRNVYDLRNVPIIITDETRNYLECRGYDLVSICKSRRQSK